MNRRELVRAVAAHTGQEVKQVDSVVAGLTEVITAVVSQGERVSLPSFAKFAKVERAARMGRNPATGEQIRIKASKRARITALKGFKDAVMTPSQAPKLAKGVWPTDPALLVKKVATPAPAARATSAKRTATATRKATTARKAAPAKRKATTARKAAPAKRKATTARKAAPARRTTTKRPAARKVAARRR